MNNTKTSATITFRDAAKQGLLTLKTLWNGGKTFLDPDCGGGCFWMAGNAFNTAIDCMVQTQQPDTFGQTPGTSLASEAVQYFNGKIPPGDPTGWGKLPDSPWVDDFGWWGIAFVTAYRNADNLGYVDPMKTQLRTYADNCWVALNACWDPSAVTVGNPPTGQITGGIPNSQKSYQLLAGRNCVTNECYWLLSSYLYACTGDQKYLTLNGANGNNFFGQAKNLGVLYTPAGLVLERFLGLNNTNWNEDWTWLGDQGLFLACCHYNQNGSGPTDPWQDPTVLFDVLVEQNTVSTGKGKVLHEELAPIGNGDFHLDYACGKGTLMRTLKYLSWDWLKQFSPPSPYDDFIKTNAAAVWNNQNQEGVFPFFWAKEAPEPTDSDWRYPPTTVQAVLHAAGLSALNAALVNWSLTVIDSPLAATAGLA